MDHMDFVSRGTRPQHLTLCGVCVCVWCPLDGCDAPSGQRGKTTVQSQSACIVHLFTQPWPQHSHEKSKNIGMSIGVAWFPDYGHIVAGIFLQQPDILEASQ